VFFILVLASKHLSAVRAEMGFQFRMFLSHVHDQVGLQRTPFTAFATAEGMFAGV
jgi:hypothetical protein